LIDREKWGRRIRKILTLDSHPGHIAAGFAVGTFISFTPFFGLHTAMAVVASFVLRLNKVTCVTGSWLNTPLTIFPVLGLSYKLGRVLLGLPPAELHVRSLEWAYLRKYATSLLLGSSVLGFVAAIIAYFACYWLIVRFRKRDEALRELAEEMETVGEELD
jgi:uncharacterized protein